MTESNMVEARSPSSELMIEQSPQKRQKLRKRSRKKSQSFKNNEELQSAVNVTKQKILDFLAVKGSDAEEIE